MCIWDYVLTLQTPSPPSHFKNLSNPFTPFTAAARPPPSAGNLSTSIHHRLHLYPPPSPPTAAIFSTSKLQDHSEISCSYLGLNVNVNSKRNESTLTMPRYWLGDFRRKRAMTSKEKFNHAHAKLRNVIERAFGVLKARFPILKSMPKFPLVKQRDITIACFAIHNFIRNEGLSDDFFAQYDQSDIHVNENVRDDNDGDVEVVQPIGSEADQQYMINLRDDIATQIMQARS
ncbi:putative nuclease HARBI1 [Tanacetum coccineum]